MHAFQFHTGSIKSRAFWNQSTAATSFNSILVRLKVKVSLSTPTVTLFQFHTGSIKRSLRCQRIRKDFIGFNSILVRLKATMFVWSYRRLPSFNSILVRLKGCYAQWLRFGEQTGFNSILVRLKAASSSAIATQRKTFQFHTGSIKSYIILAGAFMIATFQFHTGSIKSGWL